MRIGILLLLIMAQWQVVAQDFKLDRIRSVFDRSLRDFAVLNDQGQELFYLKAESFQRHTVVGEERVSEEVRYYRIIFPNARLEAEIPYVSRRKIKRFIRDHRLIEGNGLDAVAVQKVIRLYPDFFTRERLFAHRIRP